MDKNRLAVDKFGNSVRVGDKVRLVTINWEAISWIDKQEQFYLKSMIGEEFSVEEIDDTGGLWITKWWNYETDSCFSHSLCLESSEFELSRKGG